MSPEDLHQVRRHVFFSSNFLSRLPDYVTLDWFIPPPFERNCLAFDPYGDEDETEPAKDAIDLQDMANR